MLIPQKMYNEIVIDDNGRFVKREVLEKDLGFLSLNEFAARIGIVKFSPFIPVDRDVLLRGGDGDELVLAVKIPRINLSTYYEMRYMFDAVSNDAEQKGIPYLSPIGNANCVGATIVSTAKTIDFSVLGIDFIVLAHYSRSSFLRKGLPTIIRGAFVYGSPKKIKAPGLMNFHSDGTLCQPDVKSVDTSAFHPLESAVKVLSFILNDTPWNGDLMDAVTDTFCKEVLRFSLDKDEWIGGQCSSLNIHDICDDLPDVTNILMAEAARTFDELNIN